MTKDPVFTLWVTSSSQFQSFEVVLANWSYQEKKKMAIFHTITLQLSQSSKSTPKMTPTGGHILANIGPTTWYFQILLKAHEST